MHNLELIFQEPQTLNHAIRHPRQHVLGDIAAGDMIQTLGIHVLHAIVDAGFNEEGAVEIDDVGRGGAVENVELGDDRLELRIVQFEANFLRERKRVVNVGSSSPAHHHALFSPPSPLQLARRNPKLTLSAIVTFVGLCQTFCTVP